MATKTSKTKYTLEYIIKSPPHILYEFLTEPSELNQWFADHVDSNGRNYVFEWDGNTQTATVIDLAEDQMVRFHWDGAPKDEFFEFKIDVSEVSNETVLIITDFAEPKEMKDQQRLWDQQVLELKRHMGSI